ncbi:cytochrome c oxidase subunit 3 [Acidisoma sp. S159]|uniref:cytochrome c oxidase subunit 3 n=1 Tax=Acidisoma sp. S159 TaxID=1747225 RepID=UPI00131BFBC7|nr:cytochrome c oxidase subunit 3 [Acidisoma sp. S159]
MAIHQRPATPDSVLWQHEAEAHDDIATRTLGFWLYMMSDALIFAALFAAYGVLDQTTNLAGGPGAHQIVHPLAGFWQTLAVMTSVFAYSLASVAMKMRSQPGVILYITIALVLGLVFIGLELGDFARLIALGDGPDRSGFLSIYFVLIGTHGLHMAFGILWMLVMIVQVARSGFTPGIVARLLNLRMFWQFQASVWVCVYAFVYLRGAF